MRSRRGRADVAHPSHRHVDRRPAVETSPRRRRSSLPLTTPRQCNEERRRNTPRVVPSLFFVLAPERNGSETSRDGSRGALRRATTAAPPRGTSLFLNASLRSARARADCQRRRPPLREATHLTRALVVDLWLVAAKRVSPCSLAPRLLPLCQLSRELWVGKRGKSPPRIITQECYSYMSSSQCVSSVTWRRHQLIITRSQVSAQRSAVMVVYHS